MIEPELAIDRPAICCYREIEFEKYPPEIWHQNVPEMPKFPKWTPPGNPPGPLESFLSAVIIVKGYWKFFLDPQWGKLQGPNNGIGPGIYPRIVDNPGFPNDAMASLQIAEPTAMTPNAQIILFSSSGVCGGYDVFTNSFAELPKIDRASSMIIFKGTWELYHYKNFDGKDPVRAGPGIYLGHAGKSLANFLSEGGLRSAKLLSMG